MFNLPEPSPAERAELEGMMHASAVDAARQLALYVFTRAAEEEAGGTSSPKSQSLALLRTFELIQMESVHIQAMVNRLLQIISNLLYYSHGESWAQVIDAVTDKGMPLVPGYPVSPRSRQDEEMDRMLAEVFKEAGSGE